MTCGRRSRHFYPHTLQGDIWPFQLLYGRPCVCMKSIFYFGVFLSFMFLTFVLTLWIYTAEGNS